MQKKASDSTLPPLALRFTVKETCNEDDGFCARKDGLCLLAAFDGCGGMGGRKYQLLENHTSAYLGSHLYADALLLFFEEHAARLREDGEGLREELETLLRESAEACKRDYLDREPSAIVGSMARALPSTAALALIAELERRCRFYWAGDSRGYVLEKRGLRQITRDDLVGSPDAFENIRADAALSNFLCADRPFTLREEAISLPRECVVLTATDGAFGYLPTPMHFEALLLETLAEAGSMEAWGEALERRLRPVTADDVTLMLHAVGYPCFGALKAALAPRLAKLRKRYLPDPAADEDAQRALWKQYEAEMQQ